MEDNLSALIPPAQSMIDDRSRLYRTCSSLFVDFLHLVAHLAFCIESIGIKCTGVQAVCREHVPGSRDKILPVGVCVYDICTVHCTLHTNIF